MQYPEWLSSVDQLSKAYRDELLAWNQSEDFPTVHQANDERNCRLTAFGTPLGKKLYLPDFPPNLVNCEVEALSLIPMKVDTADLLSPSLPAEPAILFLTNNILAKIIENSGYSAILALRRAWADSIIVLHDYDCHHWHRMSFIGQVLSDFYIPAHRGAFHLLSPYLESVQPWTPIGSIQWRAQYILDNLNLLSTSDRSDSPLGRHTFYPEFTRRNRVLMTLGQRLPYVQLSTMDYHMLTESEKLLDWISYRSHFVVPVGFDLPIRCFDALVTGGIPIVPIHCAASLAEIGVDSSDYVAYSAKDIIDPTRVIEEANEKFYARPVAQRVIENLGLVHVTNMVNRILTASFNV